MQRGTQVPSNNSAWRTLDFAITIANTAVERSLYTPDTILRNLSLFCSDHVLLVVMCIVDTSFGRVVSVVPRTGMSS